MRVGNAPVMADLGEKAFLAGLLPGLHADPRFVNGFGHDASVIDIGLPGMDLVMKVDRAAKPLAALNGWADFRVWGRIAVTANCSDILAVGGKPVAFMLAVSVTRDTPAETVREIITGAVEECVACGVAYLGGDMKEAASANIVGAAVGTIQKGFHFDRRRGQPGDILILAGSVGGFLGAYWSCVGRETPPVSAVDYLAHPKAAWSEARAMAEVAGVRSACDLSDGLAASALGLMQPGAGALLDFDSLPFHRLAKASAKERDVDLLPYAFGVGDWGILYAAESTARASVEELRKGGLAIAVVGEIIDHAGLFLRRGSTFAVTAPENEHFHHRMEDEGSYFEEQERRLVLTPASLPNP